MSKRSSLRSPGPALAIAALFLLVSISPAVSAQDQPELWPWILQEGAEYHATTGRLGAATVSMGPAYNGTGIIAGDACAYSKLQPEFERGRIRLQAMLADGTPLQVDLDRFSPWQDTGTRIIMDQSMDGSRLHGQPIHPETEVEVAVHGLATLLVNQMYYDDPMQAVGQYNYSADLHLTRSGYRDDDGAIRGGFNPGAGRTEEGDIEMHMRLRSNGDTGADIESTITVPPAGPAPTRLLVNPEYLERHTFQNLRFGGTGQMDITVTSEAPPGLNDVRFRVRDPTGIVLLNESVEASLLSPGTASASFPLDLFGNYQLEVTGSVTLASYEVVITQQPSRPMDLWFWWEDVAYGVPALHEYARCLDEIGTQGELSSSAVGRPEPPQLRKLFVVLGIIGSIMIGLTAITLAGTAIANATHRSSYKK